MNVFLFDVIAYIEAPAHAACITLLADVVTFFILLIFIQSLRCRNGKISILQLGIDLVFLKSREINIYFVRIICLSDICLCLLYTSDAADEL